MGEKDHILTKDEVYGLHGKRKYLLRSEIDPLRGLKTLRKDTVHFVWNNPGLSDRAIQEGTYGDPIQKYGDIESELDRIHAKNPTAIWDYITNKAFKGWKIVMESPGARQ